MTDYREVRTTQQEQGHSQRVTTFKVTQLIWLLLGILESLLALRVIFKLIGVNPSNLFASLLYNVTEIFVAPFASLIGAPSAGGMVLEISTILAMIIYLLIGWAVERVVYVLFYRPRGPVTVNQTTIAEHSPMQAPQGVVQTFTTDRTPVQASQVVVPMITTNRTPVQDPASETRQTTINHTNV